METFEKKHIKHISARAGKALSALLACLLFSHFLSCSGRVAPGAPAGSGANDAVAPAPDSPAVSLLRDGAVENDGINSFTDPMEADAAPQSERVPGINSVRLSRSELRLRMDQRAVLAAALDTVMDDSELAGTVWSSSDERVVRTGADGAVIPVFPGRAVITAASSADPSVSASCAVEVVPVIRSLRLGVDELEIRVGREARITAEVASLPDVPEWQGVVWSVSDPSVVSVDPSGLISGVMPGKAVVEAQSVTDPSFTASCLVTALPSIESVSLSELSLELRPGASRPLAAAVRAVPNLPEYETVRWSTSDPSIAIVTQSGVIMPVSTGEAVITAASLFDGDISASCRVNVRPNAMRLTLDRDTLAIRMGTRSRLTAYPSVAPAGSDSEALVWESSDASVLTVDDQGNLLPLRLGRAIITASFLTDSSVCASCSVTVLPSVLSVDVPGDVLTLSAGSSVQLDFLVRAIPDSFAFKEVEWVSENPNVASVDARGLVTGVFPGQTRIVAVSRTDPDFYGSRLVTVAPSVESVALDRENTVIKMGDSERLRASVHAIPDSSAYRGCLWSSSNTSVLEVDGKGMIRPVMPGTAVVTAHSEVDPSVSASCAVTVLPRVVTVLLSGTVVADKGDVVSLPVDVICVPDSGVYKAVDLASSDESVVRVDPLGRLECMKEGTVLVTAASGTDPSKSASCVVVVRDPMNYDVNMVRIEGDADAPVRLGPSSPVYPFWISRCEVTRGLFRDLMGYDPSGPFVESLQDNPVERVSWLEAIEFCNRLSDQAGYAKFYLIGSDGSVLPDPAANGFRLPTLKEWEFAARGGKEFIYPGSDDLDSVAWHKANSSSSSHLIGLKLPNGYGLYDMAGNVSEWCWDGTEEGHFHLGGSWLFDSSYCLLDAASNPPVAKRAVSGIGFRLARSVR